MQQNLNRVSISSLRIAGWVIAASLFVAPLVAMQFTAEVNWSAGDFIVAAVLLCGASVAVELALRSRGSASYKLGAVLGIGGALLLVAANLAVGIAGAESNPANARFMAVPLVGIAGAFVARFRAGGMMKTMTVMAAAQVAVGAIVGLQGDVVPATFGFASCWLLAAWQFRKAV